MYRIANSIDRKIIGYCETQCVYVNNQVFMDHPLSYHNFHFQRPNNISSVIVPIPYLMKRAKVTDLISCPGVSLGLLISKKLKDILESTNHPDLIFYPTRLILLKDQREIDYWIVNHYGNDLHYIDFERSTFVRYGANNTSKVITVQDEITLAKHIAENPSRFPNYVYISNLYLKPDIEKDLILLKGIYKGADYIISDQLKRKCDELGCTGIEYEKINQ